MKITISEELKQLNNLFKNNNIPLFIVGGFVRDSLLLLNPNDIDLASNLKNDELFELLKNTNFTVQQGSKKLGTCIIKLNNKTFEHTTFREESYLIGGFHTPTKVNFVNDIKTDAKRRDFTINSFYYDIQKEQVLDFFNSKSDLQQKTVKAIISPKIVFKSDGLRILRMIRIACELNFKIDYETYKTAKEMVYQLNDISKDRLFKEFQLILLAKQKYGFLNLVALEQLFNLGALEYIFKGLQQYESASSLKNLKQHLFYYLLPNNTYPFLTFYLDLSNYLSEKENTKPSVILSKTLNIETCGISKKEKKCTLDFVKAYQQLKKCKDEITTKKFIQDHLQQLEPLFFVLNNQRDNALCDMLHYNYNYMLEHKMPLNLKQLAVDGKTIEKELKIENKKQIGVLLNKALKFCLLQQNNNTKAKIITHLKEEQKKEEEK